MTVAIWMGPAMQQMRDFIESYCAAWSAIISGELDIMELTRFFHLPCLMVGQDGEVTEYQSAGDVEAFNLTRLTAFREGGASHARLRGIDVGSEGPHLALVVVNWELLRKDGRLERAWRHYYTLHIGAEGPRILVSGFQTGA
ncbi:hypothetical protein [Sedimentitalea todarodis]|uniref:SnoaL-like domain-containing protein n=1 Tax=Sedimentitalea todarodis TaxID=1631240 RepID=A0ABU3VA64_9RHOB|nr:hypothetical protein [Sedimentitalea todarodis]MDU9003047.1 hypothetical protein [Sedimentitalea todarodis]